MTLFPYIEGGFHLAIHPLPQSFERARSVREITNKIVESKSIEEVLVHFREFLTSDQWRPAYRVREYAVNKSVQPTCLKCSWHDSIVESGEHSPRYRSDIQEVEIRRTSSDGKVSFFCIDHFCIVLVASHSNDIADFLESYPTQIKSNGWFQVSDTRFQDFAMYVPQEGESVAKVYEDEVDSHCWLDIPFGQKEPQKICRKISVTPQGKRGHFSPEEMEEIITLHAVANTQIENILAKEQEKHQIKLNAIHEMSQPSFAALASIEWLRKKDRQNGVDSSNDKQAFYAKKNIETSLRLITFLNESPLISREKPVASYAPQTVNLLSGVVAPIVNMFRHEEFLQARQRSRDIQFTSEYLEDVHLKPDGRAVSFRLNTEYTIEYDALLNEIELRVDARRLQQVFYNLLTNASKFKKADTPLQLQVKVRRDSDYSSEVIEDYRHFYSIDILDQGIGFSSGEEEDVFGLDVRGTGVDHTNGSGRGLYFVREIMLTVGGDVVVVQNRNPTCIRLLFPAACRQGDWHENEPLNLSRQRSSQLRSMIIESRRKA